MRQLNSNPPGKVFILPEAKEKLDAYVSLAKGEISGLGKVKRLKRGVLLIEDVFIFSQKCTPTSTNLDRMAVADFLTDMITAGEDSSAIKLWWHSHADMEVYWSTTDDRTIYGFNNEWMLSVVVNFFGDSLCRIDAFQPMQTTAHDLSLQVLLSIEPEALELLRQEVALKVVHTDPKVMKGDKKNGLLETDGYSIPTDVELFQG